MSRLNVMVKDINKVGRVFGNTKGVDMYDLTIIEVSLMLGIAFH